MLLPAQLEHVPFRVVDRAEHLIFEKPDRLAPLPGQLAKNPLFVRLAADQHVLVLHGIAWKRVEHLLQGRAVMTLPQVPLSSAGSR